MGLRNRHHYHQYFGPDWTPFFLSPFVSGFGVVIDDVFVSGFGVVIDVSAICTTDDIACWNDLSKYKAVCKRSLCSSLGCSIVIDLHSTCAWSDRKSVV